jgi:phage-related holin
MWSNVLKYLVFGVGCVLTYFEPINFLMLLVVVLFGLDFVTGVLKSRKIRGRWTLQSKKLRWSFVKMFVYMFVIACTFFITEMMQLSEVTGITAAKVEVWCVVYIEGISIVENLLVLFPGDKFLRFIHFLLSVEFLKYVPVLSNFLKEKEEDETNS